MMDLEQIEQEVRKALDRELARGKRMDDIAASAGVTRSWLYAWKRGAIQYPSFQMMAKLHRSLIT